MTNTHKPLGPGERRMLEWRAMAAVLVFYGFFIAALVCVLLLIAIELAFYVALIRIVIGYFFLKPIRALSGLAKAIAGSLFQRSSPDYERAAAEKNILQNNGYGELSSHPSPADRIAAAPGVGGLEGGNLPALRLLGSPDEIASRAAEQVSSIAATEQRRHSHDLEKDVKSRRPTQIGSVRPVLWVILSSLCLVVALMFLLFLAFDTQSTPAQRVARFAVLAVLIAAYVLFLRFLRKPVREILVLPVPRMRDVLAAIEIRDEARRIEQWQDALETELISTAAAMSRGTKAWQYWAQKGYEALAMCDYRRAWVASNLCLKIRYHCLEGLLARSVSACYLCRYDEAWAALNKAFAQNNLGPSLTWGLGWTFYMHGNGEEAEAYLLHALAMRPENATMLSILATCRYFGNSFPK